MSAVLSSSILNNPSNISGRWSIKSIFGTASSTDIQDITNCLAKPLFVNILSRRSGIKISKSNEGFSVTISCEKNNMFIDNHISHDIYNNSIYNYSDVIYFIQLLRLKFNIHFCTFSQISNIYLYKNIYKVLYIFE